MFLSLTAAAALYTSVLFNVNIIVIDDFTLIIITVTGVQATLMMLPDVWLSHHSRGDEIYSSIDTWDEDDFLEADKSHLN